MQARIQKNNNELSDLDVEKIMKEVEPISISLELDARIRDLFKRKVAGGVTHAG
jgi:hypothetical protein